MAPISHLPAWGFLLLVNVILLIFGMFMDDAASAVVLGPIIAPIAWSLGIDPIHIGAIFCTNLVIGRNATVRYCPVRHQPHRQG